MFKNLQSIFYGKILKTSRQRFVFIFQNEFIRYFIYFYSLLKKLKKNSNFFIALNQDYDFICVLLLVIGKLLFITDSICWWKKFF